MRVADVDMMRPNQQCPPDFKLITGSRWQLCACLSGSPQMAYPTTKSAGKSSPTRTKLLMHYAHTLATTQTDSITR